MPSGGTPFQRGPKRTGEPPAGGGAKPLFFCGSGHATPGEGARTK